MIRLNDEQYWLYAAVDPETSELLHTKLEPTITKILARSFLTELSEKHGVRMNEVSYARGVKMGGNE